MISYFLLDKEYVISSIVIVAFYYYCLLENIFKIKNIKLKTINIDSIKLMIY